MLTKMENRKGTEWAPLLLQDDVEII
jgi:hypothetical protein